MKGVYFIRAGEGEFTPVKIGYSTDVAKRLGNLQTANAEKLYLMMVVKGDEKTEKEIHQQLKHCRIRREWFRGLDVEGYLDILMHSKADIYEDDFIKIRDIPKLYGIDKGYIEEIIEKFSLMVWYVQRYRCLTEEQIKVFLNIKEETDDNRDQVCKVWE